MDAWKIKQVGPNEISVKLPEELLADTGGKDIPPEVLARAIVKWLRENPAAGPGTRCGIRCADGTEWRCGIRNPDGTEYKCGIRGTGESASKCMWRAADGTEWPV